MATKLIRKFNILENGESLSIHSAASKVFRVTTATLLSAIVSTSMLAPAAKADTLDKAPPNVLHSSVTPDRVDVIDGPADITVRFDAEDFGTGVDTDKVLVHTETQAVPEQRLSLVSGDRFSGTYETTLSIPEQAPPGNWNLYVHVVDLAGNIYEGNGNAWIASFDVTSLGDNEAPITTTSLSSTLVDVTDKPAIVQAELIARDRGIGIAKDARIMSRVTFGSSGSSGQYIQNSSSDPHTAIFTTESTFGTDSTPGRYRFYFDGVSDRNGNRTGQVYAGEVTVATRPSRGKRPVLENTNGLLRAHWTPTSEVLDVLEYEAQFSGENVVRVVRTTDTAASIAGLPGGIYTARVRAKNQLGWGAWSTASDPKNLTPSPVTPIPVSFADQDGTTNDSYTVPAVTGVEYQLAGKTIAAGTYPGAGTVTVTARALVGYVLADGAPTSWSATFKKTYSDYMPPARSPFADVTAGQQFYKEMAWLAETGISTGWVDANGTRTYRPLQSINRDAMAAFLYRAAGSPAYTPPAKSPFADVTAGQQFYKEMAWLAETGISTGWVDANGTRTYRPLQSINRDAMAAFLYRAAGSPAYTPPAKSPFADVTAGQQFYKEMAWLAETGISTGWVDANGTRTYRPLQSINRDAMAAFLYRATRINI